MGHRTLKVEPYASRPNGSRECPDSEGLSTAHFPRRALSHSRLQLLTDLTHRHLGLAVSIFLNLHNTTACLPAVLPAHPIRGGLSPASDSTLLGTALEVGSSCLIHIIARLCRSTSSHASAKSSPLLWPVGWAWSRAPKGCWFYSQSGHRPGFSGSIPGGGCAGSSSSMFYSHINVSLPLALKIN